MYLSCFGYNLDLAIRKGLNMPQHHAQIEKALSRCRSLVAAFSQSWKKIKDLREKQAQLGLPEHKLVGAVATQWGSTHDMVTQIIEQQAIPAVLATEAERPFYERSRMVLHVTRRLLNS